MVTNSYAWNMTTTHLRTYVGQTHTAHAHTLSLYPMRTTFSACIIYIHLYFTYEKIKEMMSLFVNHQIPKHMYEAAVITIRMFLRLFPCSRHLGHTDNEKESDCLKCGSSPATCYLYPVTGLTMY